MPSIYKRKWYKIHNFDEWLNLWEEATCLQVALGLLHEGICYQQVGKVRRIDPRSLDKLLEIADPLAINDPARHSRGVCNQEYGSGNCPHRQLRNKAVNTLLTGALQKDDLFGDLLIDPEVFAKILDWLFRDHWIMSSGHGDTGQHYERIVRSRLTKIMRTIEPHDSLDDKDSELARLLKPHRVKIYRVCCEFGWPELITGWSDQDLEALETVAMCTEVPGKPMPENMLDAIRVCGALDVRNYAARQYLLLHTQAQADKSRK